MSKDDLVTRAKDPKYISGIHNYCDRWCERCTFTSRCLNFSLSEERFGDLQEKDALNEEFWKRFSELLHDTLTMATELAKEMGVDLDSIHAEIDSEGDDVDKDSPIHLLSHMTENYSATTGDWFQSNEHLLYEKIEELNRLHLVSSEDRQFPHARDFVRPGFDDRPRKQLIKH